MTASVRLARCVLEAARRCGANPTELAGQAGLDLTVLENPEGRVPHETQVAIWDRAGEFASSASFGLSAAELIGFDTWGMLGWAMASSPTAGGALQQFSRYSNLIYDEIAVTLEPERNHLRVKYEIAPPFNSEMAVASLAIIVMMLGRAGGDECAPLCVTVRGPNAPRGFQDRLGVAVTAGQADNAVLLPRSILEIPVLSADPGNSRTLEQQLQARVDQLRQTPSHLTESVRGVIRRALPTGVPELPFIARTLRISERTLQRRLQQNGTRCAELVEEVRLEQAKRYLADPNLSVAEVASLLGFSESSAFHRAYRRWTGKTPRQRAGS